MGRDPEKGDIFMENKKILEAKPQEFYRSKEAAALLCIGVSTFWRWVQIGKLPKGKKIGERTTIWKRDDLLTLLD